MHDRIAPADLPARLDSLAAAVRARTDVVPGIGIVLGSGLGGPAAAADVVLEEGVYAGLLGPNYETPAEVRMLRALGADAVGLSTVLEAIAARWAGLELAGGSPGPHPGAGGTCVPRFPRGRRG